MVLFSAILLGFADRTKMAGKEVGPPAEKPNPPEADSTQPTNKLWPMLEPSPKIPHKG
jgi:hypothetical protein